MNSHENPMEDCFYGATTVGERGQVVIPAEARHVYGIKPGDKLLIMKHPGLPGLVMAKFEDLRDHLDDIAKSLERAKEKESK